MCAQLDAPKWPCVFSIASRVNPRWLTCLNPQISSAHIQLYWRSWTEVTYSCNLTWIHRHGSSKDWASSCCQCTEITAKNNAIQLVPCVFSDALHLCLASGSFFFFWLPVLLILVSEKPPWGVDNKICIVLYCIVFLVSVIWPKCGEECGKMQKF